MDKIDANPHDDNILLLLLFPNITHKLNNNFNILKYTNKSTYPLNQHFRKEEKKSDHQEKRNCVTYGHQLL